jgi:flagellin-like protein
MGPAPADHAVSPVVGVALMVAVTVILVAILAAYLFWLPHLCDPFPPALVQVVAVHDYNEAGTVLNYDSRVLLRNMGRQRLKNRPLTAAVYADGVSVDCRLLTFHGEDFVPSHHFGIERIQGEGCRGETWEPGASVLIDFTDRTFLPGETVRVDIVDGGCVISSHSFRRSGAPAQ